ncbi:hypothetical protein CANARDRAFT_29550 [[Candida] arabinofermentans NRRL YB-2248]|uniref:Uncharacterized protein n=1 Tax=[Candida] arabinofermentans NRRL YB-2248 TaxID=983967 RepID=A0A1E4SX91_9ASCO|nr:hypothetical protein CANARDRAFT_29550 [[Candida] arabinofermentans NRRL YB-2248]
MSTESDVGASVPEQLAEAAIRDNSELISSIIEKYEEDAETLLKYLNAPDSRGFTPLHLCCRYGSSSVMDKLLDISGVDVDPVVPSSGDTPLHLAAKYSFEEPEYAQFLIEELLDVGANPTIKNKEGLKPADILGDSNDTIKSILESAEYAMTVAPPPVPDQEAEADDGPSDDETE